MNLIELKRILDDMLTAYPGEQTENLRMVVCTEDSSVGPSASSEVIFVGQGFDWESGRINIFTKDKLIKESKYEILTGETNEQII